MKTNLSEQQLKLLSTRSNAKAMWLFVWNYALVIFAFWLAATWTNPLTIVIAILMLGARQLGFGVLVHECGHGTLFESKKLNQFMGDWFAAPPVLSNMKVYSDGHRKHHQLAGTHEDPDLGNYKDYPISKERLQRKLWRDISGKTGWRDVKSIGRATANIKNLRPELRNSLIKGWCFTITLFVITLAVGSPWLFLLWVAAFVVVNPLVSRIRQVGEHAAVPNLYALDARLNTRTIRPNLLEQLFICPLGINYHLEHHILASIPLYNLPLMHSMLTNNGFYNDVHFTNGYRNLYREVTTG